MNLIIFSQEGMELGGALDWAGEGGEGGGDMID